MKVIALRCSNSDFTYAILEGTRTNPTIIASESISFPKGYEEFSLLYWFYQEIVGIISTHRPTTLVVKATEPMVRRSNNLESRIRIEGIALMAAAEAGCASACRKVKATIAKNLGMKGKSKCLETDLDTSLIFGFDSYKEKSQESILAGWSCLE